MQNRRRRVERQRAVCGQETDGQSAACARIGRLRAKHAQGRMTGAPQPFWLFQGMVSMWSVKVWPNTSLLLGGGVLGLVLLMTWSDLG